MTRFSSGIAGVVVIVFALMGSIGAGFLLNGSTEPVVVNDYDYITDVSGLYSYTPVTQYTQYSPAQNYYQYSSAYSDLGTYTTGIDYTASASANLCPVITSSSGMHTTTGSISYASLPGAVTRTSSFMVTDSTGTSIAVKIFSLSSLLEEFGSYTTATITIPGSTQSVTYGGSTYYSQPIGILDTSSGVGVSGIATAVSNHATAEGSATQLYTTSTTLISGMSIYVGTISDLTINANGTVTYTYTYGTVITSVTKNISEITMFVWTQNYTDQTPDFSANSLAYSYTTYANVEYLDPNYGVSVTTLGSNEYWSNGGSLGQVSWMCKKPTTSSSVSFTPRTASGLQASNAFTIAYSTSTGWSLTYLDASSTSTTVQIGKDWPAVQVTQYYTGDIQVSPVRTFANFTDYILATSTTYEGVAGNSSIASYQIVQTQSNAMRFACTGTTVAGGTVAGAMYDATFNSSNYFPEYTDVRISFDSVAYAGTSVAVGSWTMSVDDKSLTGSFSAGNQAYTVDLAQPWSLTWDAGSDDVELTFHPVNSTQTETVTILSDASVSPTVSLNGQWVIDTDLYKVGSHTEDRYSYNFGVWGIEDTAVFIVCTMGLSAFIAIVMRLANVPFGALDYIVIFVGNLILWVML